MSATSRVRAANGDDRRGQRQRRGYGRYGPWAVMPLTFKGRGGVKRWRIVGKLAEEDQAGEAQALALARLDGVNTLGAWLTARSAVQTPNPRRGERDPQAPGIVGI